MALNITTTFYLKAGHRGKCLSRKQQENKQTNEMHIGHAVSARKQEEDFNSLTSASTMRLKIQIK